MFNSTVSPVYRPLTRPLADRMGLAEWIPTTLYSIAGVRGLLCCITAQRVYMLFLSWPARFCPSGRRRLQPSRLGRPGKCIQAALRSLTTVASIRPSGGRRARTPAALAPGGYGRWWLARRPLHRLQCLRRFLCQPRLPFPRRFLPRLQCLLPPRRVKAAVGVLPPCTQHPERV
jgi:hypothetical protein